MDSIFKLKGRLTDDDGTGIEALLLAIVDEDDMDEDDLIGIGKTMEGGHFKLTFLGSEFRQDMLEMEMTPDIKIVASAMIDGVPKAIFQQAFPDLDWDWSGGGEVDLGDIKIAGYDPSSPSVLEGVEALPGYTKTAERLDIDDDMVRHCLAEVAPIVEKLTGWTNLLDGLNVDVQDGTSSYSMRDNFEARGVDPDSLEAKISVWIADHTLAPGMGCALYDPGTNTIVINKAAMNKVGLDALKIIVGHELVHLGQFKYTPGLKAFQKAFMVEMPANPTPDDIKEITAKAAYNIELEGYAKYIETDYLQKYHYPMATLFYHASFTDKIIHAMVSLLLPSSEGASETKASQYTDGLAIYRERETVEGVPVRFELDVAKFPGGDRFV